MKYEKFEKWMIGKKVTHVVALSSGVIVDISYEGEPDFPVKVKYDEGILAGETSWAFLRNLEFLEGKPSDGVSAQEDSRVNWEVGQVVWDTAFGEGVVVSVEEYYTEYPVKVRFKNYSVEDYTKEGKIFKDCKRCLFFSEPVVTAELFPPKKTFKSSLNKGDLIAIKDEHCSDAVIVSFLKEDEERIYYAYNDGEKDYSHKENVSVYPLGEEIKFR